MEGKCLEAYAEFMLHNSKREQRRVKTAMKKAGVSLGALAAYMGISRQALHQKLEGHTSLSAFEMLEIAGFLERGVEELFCAKR